MERQGTAEDRYGSVNQLLGAVTSETVLADMRFALKELLKQRRREQRLSQQELARKLGTDQARVSRIERADPSVSTDQLLRALFAVGATRDEIAGVIAEG
jgi:ribosome-binding protein aMBF1 (putative translation factor)